MRCTSAASTASLSRILTIPAIPHIVCNHQTSYSGRMLFFIRVSSSRQRDLRLHFTKSSKPLGQYFKDADGEPSSASIRDAKHQQKQRQDVRRCRKRQN